MLLATVLLILGTTVSLLLNGQTFTNSVAGITCLSLSISLCLYSEYRGTPDRGGGASRRIVAGLAVLVIVVLLVQLPAGYESKLALISRLKA
jgi:hypothetical protein